MWFAVLLHFRIGFLPLALRGIEVDFAVEGEKVKGRESQPACQYRPCKQVTGCVVVNGWLKEYRGVWILAHVLLETGGVQTKRPEGPVGLPRWRTRFVPTPQ